MRSAAGAYRASFGDVVVKVELSGIVLRYGYSRTNGLREVFAGFRAQNAKITEVYVWSLLPAERIKSKYPTSLKVHRGYPDDFSGRKQKAYAKP